MKCHICDQPALGQCQSCWKFYCGVHGDLICHTCRERQRARQGQHGEAAFVVLGHDDPHAGPHPATHRPPTFLPDLGTEALQRVVGVAQTARVGSTEVDLVSIEIYASGCIANFRLRGVVEDPEPDGLSRFPRTPDFSPQATDDLGSVYEGMHRGGGGGSRGHWRSTQHFSLASLAAARALRFTISEVRWMAHGPGPAVVY